MEKKGTSSARLDLSWIVVYLQKGKLVTLVRKKRERLKGIKRLINQKWKRSCERILEFSKEKSGMLMEKAEAVRSHQKEWGSWIIWADRGCHSQTLGA